MEFGDYFGGVLCGCQGCFVVGGISVTFFVSVLSVTVLLLDLMKFFFTVLAPDLHVY